jgi:F-box protein 11
MLLKDTRAQVFDNVIKSNEGIGLYIRDKSHGKIEKNQVTSFRHHILLY